MAANRVEVPKMKLGGKRFPGVVVPVERPSERRPKGYE